MQYNCKKQGCCSNFKLEIQPKQKPTKELDTESTTHIPIPIQLKNRIVAVTMLGIVIKEHIHEMSSLVLSKIRLHWDVMVRSRLCSLQFSFSLQSCFIQTLGVRSDK